MSIDTLKIPFPTATKGIYIKQGDTIPAYTWTFTKPLDFDLTGAVIKMRLYSGNQVVMDIGSDTSGITITDTKSFSIDKVPSNENNLPAGCLIGDLQIQLANDDLKTYANVEYNILKQYT
jgi:hypothetical protein